LSVQIGDAIDVFLLEVLVSITLRDESDALDYRIDDGDILVDRYPGYRSGVAILCLELGDTTYRLRRNVGDVVDDDLLDEGHLFSGLGGALHDACCNEGSMTAHIRPLVFFELQLLDYPPKALTGNPRRIDTRVDA
jgi:hypothetical protein